MLTSNPPSAELKQIHTSLKKLKLEAESLEKYLGMIFIFYYLISDFMPFSARMIIEYNSSGGKTMCFNGHIIITTAILVRHHKKKTF